MEGEAATTPAQSSRRGGGSGGGRGGDDEGVSEYEKQRISRIRENRARLEALGLPNLASSLLGPARKQGQPKEQGKGKKKKKKDTKRDGGYGDNDNEYRPSAEEDNGESSSSSSDDDDDDEEEGNGSSSRRASRRKRKNKKSPVAVTVGSKSFTQRCMNKSDAMDDNVALQKAIALSLEEPLGDSSAISIRLPQNSARNFANTDLQKDGTGIPETPVRGRKRKWNVRRMQMSEDEVVAYFFSFDEVGKGNLSLRDLQKMAVSHDFSWTDKEMADMIYSFDSDGDGKLSLEDFRRIVSRCNMLQESGNC